MNESKTYSIGELAEMAGVSRRTVRFYVQRGLIPPPAGLGCGRHYGEAHLTRILQIRELQRQGILLKRIHTDPVAEAPPEVGFEHQRVTRIRIEEGVWLELGQGVRSPSPRALGEIRAILKRTLH